MQQVLSAFLPGARLESDTPLGRGHIHATRRVVARSAEGLRIEVVAQRIHTGIFRDLDALARNWELVLERLQEAVRTRRLEEPERHCLRLLRDRDGATIHRDAEGGAWRAFPFIARSHTRESPTGVAQAERVGAAFGSFLADLAPLDPRRLDETIPDFHDLAGRRRALDAAASADALGRRADVVAELDAAARVAEALGAHPEIDPAQLPVRSVHNDCKLNNLLLDDASDAPLCVVDLDTVMPGAALFDFGELVRTAACHCEEDEPELSKVRFDFGLWHAIARGFHRGAREVLTPDEVRAFALAGPRMALENAVRFLSDHLEGDPYFGVTRAGQNRDRARVQVRLAEQMLAAEAAMRAALANLDSGAATSS